MSQADKQSLVVRVSSGKVNFETSLSQKVNPSTNILQELRHGIPNSFFKLDVHRVGGLDPIGWICKTNHFFNYYQTLEDQIIATA